jgi:hypothetical protein
VEDGGCETETMETGGERKVRLGLWAEGRWERLVVTSQSRQKCRALKFPKARRTRARNERKRQRRACRTFGESKPVEQKLRVEGL